MKYNAEYILVIQYNIYLLKPGKSLNIIIVLMYCQNNGQNYRIIINSATQCAQSSWYKENPVSPGTHWQWQRGRQRPSPPPPLQTAQWSRWSPAGGQGWGWPSTVACVWIQCSYHFWICCIITFSELIVIIIISLVKFGNPMQCYNACAALTFLLPCTFVSCHRSQNLMWLSTFSHTGTWLVTPNW